MSFRSSNHFSGISRRGFLSAAAGVGGAALVESVWSRAAWAAGDAGVDPRMAQVKARTIGIDMHNHVYPAGTDPQMSGRMRRGQGPGNGPGNGQRQMGQRGPGQGPGQGMGWPPGMQQEGSSSRALLMGEELRESGLTAVCAAYVLDFADNEKPGDARTNFLSWLTAIDAQLAKEGLKRALTLKDLEDAHAAGRPTIVQSVEGSQFIEGHLERVEEVYHRGLRHLQLLHDQDDMVKPLGEMDTRPSEPGGLTAFGAEVVKECNRLGILVDMAHSSFRTIEGAMKVSSQPIIVSHASYPVKGTDSWMGGMMKDREISWDHAKAIAGNGGVLGVWLNGANTAQSYVAGMKELVDHVGVDHVGIGTDSNLLSGGRTLNQSLQGVTVGFFNGVAAEMLRQGFTVEEISKIGGGNYCRVFGKATAAR